MIVVHVTHEAVEKMGGIGTVIEGLTTAEAYSRAVARTILVGPLFSTDRPANERLGVGGKVIYSGLDEIRPPEWREKFAPIERTHDVKILYGRRRLHEPYSERTVDVEVLLVDVYHINRVRLNLFKGQLFEKYGVPSQEFENIWEYEEYVRLAEPALEALHAIGVGRDDQDVVLLAHEYMGMPTALKAMLDGREKVKTVFYAHEVASVRPIVEARPGHDTMFYNVLSRARAEGRELEDVFPQARETFKHFLVKAARYCDRVFAVGDFVVEELKFLDRHFERMGIERVYNGIPAEPITLEQRHASRALLKKYAENLLGRTPTWVFSHVARPVLSKGIWRDLRVLHELEPLLAERDETAVYFMLGTLGGQRRKQDIRQMERDHDWPVRHEMGYPDLCGGEDVVAENVRVFNEHHRAIRAIYLNQWGFTAEACGQRMPEETGIADLRRGTDLEFGLSVYEPFGISQFEPLTFGALCAVSNVCGCSAFARAIQNGEALDNVLVGDFLGVSDSKRTEELLSWSDGERNRIEEAEGRRLAQRIVDLLPRSEEVERRRLEDGYNLARRMSWEHVVEEYVLPGLRRTAD